MLSLYRYISRTGMARRAAVAEPQVCKTDAFSVIFVKEQWGIVTNFGSIVVFFVGVSSFEHKISLIEVYKLEHCDTSCHRFYSEALK